MIRYDVNSPEILWVDHDSISQRMEVRFRDIIAPKKHINVTESTLRRFLAATPPEDFYWANIHENVQHIAQP